MGQTQDFPFDIEDVTELLHLRIRRRCADGVYTDCPICGDNRGKMKVNYAMNVWRCNYCGESGGMLKLYAKVHGISNSEAYQEICEAIQNGICFPAVPPPQPMLESCRKFLEGKLKLTMNLQKSKVVSLFSIRNFKFLGCCLGKNGRGIYIRVHRNSLQKAKQKLRELTNRSQGRNVRMVMAKVKEFIRGWIGYFYIADMKRILQSWDKWLRRRIRMYIWKQWKKPKTRVQNLKKLGIPEWQAYQWGNTRLGYWRVAGSAILSRSITNEKLALAGYYDFPAQYEQIRKLHLCD